jgi:hypothetical protein
MFKLEKAREQMKRSNAKWVAEQTGKCVRSIHNYFNGHTKPDRSTAMAIAHAFGLPLLALWDDEAGKSEAQNKQHQRRSA